MNKKDFVEKWLHDNDNSHRPSLDDFTNYVISRAEVDYPETKEQPAGVPPDHDWIRRAGLIVAKESQTYQKDLVETLIMYRKWIEKLEDALDAALPVLKHGFYLGRGKERIAALHKATVALQGP